MSVTGFALRVIMACFVCGAVACFAFISVGPYIAAAQRKQPGPPWLQATFWPTLIFHPEWYTPAGQRLRRLWLLSFGGFMLFGVGATVCGIIARAVLEN